MPSFILRNLDPDFWSRVQAKATREGVTVKALILRLLTQWLGAAVVALIAFGCTSPVEPTLPGPLPQPARGTPASLTLSATPGVGAQGGHAAVSVRVVDALKVPVPDVRVTLEASAGSLDPTELVTDGEGRGTAVLTAPAGSVTLTASIAHGPTSVSLVAVQPSVPLPHVTSLQMTATTVTVGRATDFAIILEGGTVRTVAWDYGDGTQEEIGSATATHTYPAANTYTVVALVTDTDGHATSIRNVARVLPVSPLPPTPNPNPNPTPTPIPVFTRSGTGASVFDLPTYVTRVRITGDYAGFCENFIVHIAGRGVVNEILGTCSNGSGPHFDGTYATSGGQVEVLNSTGISWTFTELR
jgi:hypothetical protein